MITSSVALGFLAGCLPAAGGPVPRRSGPAGSPTRESRPRPGGNPKKRGPAAKTKPAAPQPTGPCKDYSVHWHVLYPELGLQRRLEVRPPGAKFKVRGWSCSVSLSGSTTGYVPGNRGWEPVGIDAAMIKCLDREELNNVGTDFGCNNNASSFASRPQFNKRKEDLQLTKDLKIFIVCETVRCKGGQAP